MHNSQLVLHAELKWAADEMTFDTTESAVHHLKPFQLMQNLWDHAVMGEKQASAMNEELQTQRWIKGTGSWRINVMKTQPQSEGAAKALPPSVNRTEILTER